MAKYLSCGNIMSDKIKFSNGTETEFYLGGPAIFALEGMKLWNDDVAMACLAGEDWEGTYGAWLDRNHITREGVKVLPGETTRCFMEHMPDGSYNWGVVQGMEQLEKMDLTWDVVWEAIGPDTKGVYLYMYPFDSFFANMDTIRKKGNFKLMWEFGIDKVGDEKDLLKNIRYADLFSCNSFQAERIFGISRNEEAKILDALQALPVEFVFYRVGKKGAYGITSDEVFFCPSIDSAGPSVDPSGCGNCSTGAAAYGWIEGLGCAGATVVGCISSGFNARQYGVWPKFGKEDREHAQYLYEKAMKELIVKVR